jgi:DNA-binding transcriptional MerR regulator
VNAGRRGRVRVKGRSLPSEGPAAAVASARAAVQAHRQNDDGELFGISELCQEFGITLRTIRFYEDKGLLSPRRVNGTRVYTRRDRARLALIVRSKAIGASLADIKHYLDLYGAHGEGRKQQLQYVLEKTDATIATLTQRIADIEATLAELRIINRDVRQQLLTR